MKNNKSVVRDMMKGFDTIEEQLSNQSLSPIQKIKLFMLKMFVGLTKSVLALFGSQLTKPMDIAGLVSDRRGFELNVRGSRRKESDGQFYLSESEVEEFQKKGILGPFRLISSEEAKSLYDLANRIHADDYNGEIIFGDQKIKDVLQRNGDWNLNYGGMYRALQFPEFREVLCRPEITNRIASLLGNDLICWRSQFFEKRPQGGGDVLASNWSISGDVG